MTIFSVNTDLLSASCGGSSVVLGDSEKLSIATQIQQFVNRNAALVEQVLQSHGHAPTRDFTVVVRNTGEVFLQTADRHLLRLSQRVDAAIFQPVTQAAARVVPPPMPYMPPASAPAPVMYPAQPYAPPVSMPLYPPMHPTFPVSGSEEIQARVEPVGARRVHEREPTGRDGRDATQPIIDYFTGLLGEQREEAARQDQAYYLLHTQLLNNSNQMLDLKIAHVQEKLDQVNAELSTYSFSNPALEDLQPNSIPPLRGIGVAYRNVVHRSRYKELMKQKEALEKEIAGFRKQKGENEGLIRCPKDTRASKVRIEELEESMHGLQAENARLVDLLDQLLIERESSRPTSTHAVRASTPLQPDLRFSGTPAPVKGRHVRFFSNAPPAAHSQVPTTARRPAQHQQAMRARQQPPHTVIDMDPPSPEPPAFFNPATFTHAPPAAHSQVPTTARRPAQHQQAMRARQQPPHTVIDMDPPSPESPALFTPAFPPHLLPNYE